MNWGGPGPLAPLGYAYDYFIIRQESLPIKCLPVRCLLSVIFLKESPNSKKPLNSYFFRNEIACAIGRRKRNEHFNAIENHKEFFDSDWECGDEITNLWSDLINADYSRKSCSLEQALSALVNIEEVNCS